MCAALAGACQQGLQQVVFGTHRLLGWLGFQVVKRPALLGAHTPAPLVCPATQPQFTAQSKVPWGDTKPGRPGGTAGIYQASTGAAPLT